ncbi:MAG: hypothetical protein A6F71_04945 [Cycloclasticus sp. symbiont of Poecilosclerida sp. M]|nr:MAG: hypothetical protein A6F71_04945 [Cycloclasticus sp. symbiont of Poecilosclerida sp. M]
MAKCEVDEEEFVSNISSLGLYSWKSHFAYSSISRGGIFLQQLFERSYKFKACDETWCSHHMLTLIQVISQKYPLALIPNRITTSQYSTVGHGLVIASSPV